MVAQSSLLDEALVGTSFHDPLLVVTFPRSSEGIGFLIYCSSDIVPVDFLCCSVKLSFSFSHLCPVLSLFFYFLKLSSRVFITRESFLLFLGAKSPLEMASLSN